MDSLTTITRREADKLVLEDVKRNLIGAGLAQGGILLSYWGFVLSSDSNAPEIIRQTLLGLVLLAGIGATCIEMKRVYDVVKGYISDPAEYVKSNYHKELV